MTKAVFIGGKERHVSFGINANCEIETILGTPLGMVNFESVNSLRALVYAGLKWGLYRNNGVEPKPDFTLFEVGEWIRGEDGLPKAEVQDVLKLFVDSLPKKKESESANQSQSQSTGNG